MQRILIFFFLLAACQAQPSEQVEVNKPSKVKSGHTQIKNASSNHFEITTLQNANGWGYQIRQNGKLLLDQPVIPGRPGNAGFQTQADAQRVAELVKTKLQAKVFPPTVSEDDLKNLNIH
jgi:hypothetical protein